MRLIITWTIKKTELLRWKRVFSLKVVKQAARKAFGGIGREIKSSLKLRHTCLKKLNLTSAGGAGRIVFLLEIDSQTSILVMLRPKNDKMIGANMTIKNPRFKNLLERNIDMILGDIKAGNYEEYNI